jgi:hypothetical protein
MPFNNVRTKQEIFFNLIISSCINCIYGFDHIINFFWSCSITLKFLIAIFASHRILLMDSLHSIAVTFNLSRRSLANIGTMWFGPSQDF